VSGEKFLVKDFIFVNSEEQPEDSAKERNDDPKMIDDSDPTLWVALIVDIRAQNPWEV
jgi:hypothetical protein